MGSDFDRRMASRHDAFLPVEIEGRVKSANEFIDDLSVSGAYVRTSDPAPLRTRLKLVIVAPKSRRRFAFDAEVMRTVDPEQAAAGEWVPGMGIAFLDLGSGDPRPKVVEILNEMRAVEDDARARAIEPDPSGPQPVAPPIAAAPAPDRDAAEAVARLDQFLAQARTQNHYEILGVDASTATPAMVKKHYHRRSKEFHPDRFHRMRTPAIDAKVEELYGLLTRAYETLKDTEKREAWDKSHGIRESVEFRRAAAKARLEEAIANVDRKRFFAATIGLKIALGLDPGNPDIQRKLDEVERHRKFFVT